ncbi:MAG: DUF484 family protein [Rhodobacteraceae bacterium]|nr:DUF484 family protein [Paracoccaceae bacterium]
MSDAIKKLKADILSDPSVVLDDSDVMRALLHAQDAVNGERVVDLRNVFLERLEQRLERLEDTHASVIAAAYDNMAGTSQVQRAVLSVLEPRDFQSFLDVLQSEVANILGVDMVRLCIERKSQSNELPHAVITPLEPGAIREIVTNGRDIALRKVTLRLAGPNKSKVFTAAAGRVKSEALLRLDLGQKQLPALLAFGSENTDRFSPEQGVDLLTFFAEAFERILRRWVA